MEVYCLQIDLRKIAVFWMQKYKLKFYYTFSFHFIKKRGWLFFYATLRISFETDVIYPNSNHISIAISNSEQTCHYLQSICFWFKMTFIDETLEKYNLTDRFLSYKCHELWVKIRLLFCLILHSTSVKIWNIQLHGKSTAYKWE